MKKIFYPLVALLMTACSDKPVNYSADITPYFEGKECAISFTYDDGMLCQYTDIAPELEKRGFRGTFWIIGANMGKDAPDYPWMTWDQVAELSRRGHEMSNHTWNHPSLPSLRAEEVEQELALCDSMLESVTGKRPITMAYPYNAMSPEVVAQCEKGRVGTRLTQVGHGWAASKTTPDTMTLWLDSLICNKEWGVTMTHGTTYGWDMWEHPEWLYNFYDEVKAKEDSVWVGTFAEVSSYIKEREASLVIVMGDSHQLQLTVRHSLDQDLFTQPLTVKVEGFDWTGLNPKATQGDEETKVINRGSYLLVNVKPVATPAIVKW